MAANVPRAPPRREAAPRAPGHVMRAASMAPVLLLFFLSGATGLVYETVWGRALHLVFGTSQFAIATVLAAFMTGLAAGGAVGARLAPRLRRPLRAYAALELGIGLFALAFPGVVALLEPLYLGFYHAVEPGPVLFGVFQFFVLGLALLVPTACMGATLPVLTRFVDADPGGAGKAVGRLYATNTFGAVVGTWGVGFVLLPALGVQHTTWLAAGANLLLAAVAFLLDRRGHLRSEAEARAAAALGLDPALPDPAAGEAGLGAPSTTAAVPPPPAAPLPAVALYVAAALAGFGSLAMEVAWFRLLALVLGASTYAFTVMLLAFLVGIAAGGEVGGRLGDRWPRRVGALLVGAQLWVALCTWIATWIWPSLPLSFVQLYFALVKPPPPGIPSPELLWPVKCLLAMAVMVPAALGMGATFPLLTRAASAARAELSAVVGRVYTANTFGSLLGAFLAGFVFLPTIRVSGTTLLALSANLVAAALLAGWRAAPRARAGAALALAAALLGVWSVRAPWDPMWMTSGVYKYVDNLQEPTREEIEKRFIDRYQLLWYREGLSTVVTVARNSVTGNQWLANNGKIDASTTTDMPTQVLVAHTPFLFTGDEARRTLLIGLASGITLGAMTLHPEVERIDVAELEPSMPEAARLFANHNHGALDDPRVQILPNDGRNQLLLTPPGTYDLIVAEPSNPWLTGVSNLFTREFFEMGKARLAPGGIWSQWVQMYGMDGRDLKAVIRTFCEVYPHVLVFSTIRDADMVMVGSERPIVMTAELADRLVHKNVGVESELLQVGVRDGYDLLSHYLFDRDTAMVLTEGTPLNTDDNLLVEYSAPHNLHRETSGENFIMLLPHAQTPLASVKDAAGLVRLAEAYAWRDDLVRALIALKEAERREPGREDVLRLYVQYQARLKERLE